MVLLYRDGVCLALPIHYRYPLCGCRHLSRWGQIEPDWPNGVQVRHILAVAFSQAPLYQVGDVIAEGGFQHDLSLNSKISKARMKSSGHVAWILSRFTESALNHVKAKDSANPPKCPFDMMLAA